jgi:hypothetical protein
MISRLLGLAAAAVLVGLPANAETLPTARC